MSNIDGYGTINWCLMIFKSIANFSTNGIAIKLSFFSHILKDLNHVLRYICYFIDVVALIVDNNNKFRRSFIFFFSSTYLLQRRSLLLPRGSLLPWRPLLLIRPCLIIHFWTFHTVTALFISPSLIVVGIFDRFGSNKGLAFVVATFLITSFAIFVVFKRLFFIMLE